MRGEQLEGPQSQRVLVGMSSMFLSSSSSKHGQRRAAGGPGASIAASIRGHVLDLLKQLEHRQPANVSVTHSVENQMRSWQGTLYRKQMYLEALYSEMLYSKALFLEYYFRSTKFRAEEVYIGSIQVSISISIENSIFGALFSESYFRSSIFGAPNSEHYYQADSGGFGAPHTSLNMSDDEGDLMLGSPGLNNNKKGRGKNRKWISMGRHLRTHAHTHAYTHWPLSNLHTHTHTCLHTRSHTQVRVKRGGTHVPADQSDTSPGFAADSPHLQGRMPLLPHRQTQQGWHQDDPLCM